MTTTIDLEGTPELVPADTIRQGDLFKLPGDEQWRSDFVNIDPATVTGAALVIRRGLDGDERPRPAALAGPATPMEPPLKSLNYRVAATDQPGLVVSILHNVMGDLGRRILANGGFGESLDCDETDCLAQALTAAGYAQAAVRLVAEHAPEDDDSDHAHLLADRGDADAVYAFAEKYVAELAGWLGIPEMAETIVTRASRKRLIAGV